MGLLSFLDLHLKTEYRSLIDNMVDDFYVPLLNESIMYKRAVGFFSSSALIEISKGISGLIKNGGKILLVASPKLSVEDIEAIESGFEQRKRIIENCIENSILEPENIYEERKLNLLANLIANGQLDIKIAFLESENSVGMFHEKMGIMVDQDNNTIAFTGSMNESKNAFSQNYESIDVFCSWTHDKERVYAKESAFNAIWNDYEPHIRIIDFPQVAKTKLERYRKTDILDLEIDLIETEKEIDQTFNKISLVSQKKCPIIPKNVEIRPYQVDAIDVWENQDFRGIFDMATGTGKTYTGLAAVERLYRKRNNRLAVYIVAPYQHLVDQWVEDIEKFGMKPIIGHSASSQRNWKNRLNDAVRGFNLHIIDHFCFICTNATFSSEYVKDQLSKTKDNVLLMVDEAHNFGAENLSKLLISQIPYRLALSATIERHGDEEGTEKLLDYFGSKCIEYSLKQAIENNMLTPYNYYPVVTSLNDDELEEYLLLTSKIFGKVDERGKRIFSDYEKMLLIKRARIVAGATNKIPQLRRFVEKYRDDNHMLIYCGATTIRDPNYKEGSADDEEKRQINIVSEMLGNELGMKISKFTSEESAQEREALKIAFDEGKHMQALVAIRCLDEGVNIPSIKTAFILASSTNPKEYIQRRGRVLRKYPGKSYADIYDFITLPLDLDSAKSVDDDVLKSVKGLVVREIVRMKDFAAISENPWEVDALINKIEEAYGLNTFEGDGEYV